MQTEFEWKIFHGFTTLGILKEIRKLMKSMQCEPQHFNGRIIFMSMFDDIMWREKKMKSYVKVMLTKLRIFLADILAVVAHSWDLDWKRHGTSCSSDDTPIGYRIWSPIFRGAFERRKLDIKEYGKKSTRFDDNEGNTEMLLRTEISAKSAHHLRFFCRLVQKLGQPFIRRFSSIL